MTNQPDPVALLGQIYDHTETVLTEIRPEHYELPTPCSEWNVRELVNHLIGSVHFMASAVAGEAMPAGDPPDFTAGNDAVGEFRFAAKRSVAVWSGDGALEGSVHLGPVEMPAQVVLGLNQLEVLTHAWDVAEALGTDRSINPLVAEAVLAASQMIITDGMRGDRFAPAVPIAEDAPAYDRLAAFLGRQPA